MIVKCFITLVSDNAIKLFFFVTGVVGKIMSVTNISRLAFLTVGLEVQGTNTLAILPGGSVMKKKQS